VVLLPLAVWIGLKEPHDPAGEQLQVTPALAGSLDTVAVILACLPITIVEGGAVVSETEMAGRILMLTLALLVPSVTEVAVIVTLPPEGTDDGAVYVVACKVTV
jgi:hypothetical protein